MIAVRSNPPFCSRMRAIVHRGLYCLRLRCVVSRQCRESKKVSRETSSAQSVIRLSQVSVLSAGAALQPSIEMQRATASIYCPYACPVYLALPFNPHSPIRSSISPLSCKPALLPVRSTTACSPARSTARPPVRPLYLSKICHDNPVARVFRGREGANTTFRNHL